MKNREQLIRSILDILESGSRQQDSEFFQGLIDDYAGTLDGTEDGHMLTCAMRAIAAEACPGDDPGRVDIVLGIIGILGDTPTGVLAGTLKRLN